jgi:LmeA-like phospholipid-binding
LLLDRSAKLAGMRRGGGSRAIRLTALAAAAVLVLLALAQLLLPRIAASQISSRVERYGHVDHVSVSAWPAVELLWGHADAVSVQARRLALTPAQAASLLWEGRGVARLDISAEAVRMGPLELSAATLRKRGAQLEAQARTSQAAAQAALGEGVSVRLLGSEGGRVRVSVGGSLFGVGAAVPALAEAQDGVLVAHPEGALLEGLRLTLFSDPHVHVEGVGASVLATQPLSYRLSMSALLG